MMKKVLLGIIAAICLILPDCTITETITYKDPTPDQSVTLLLSNGIEITKIDSDFVNWRSPNKIVIPAGEHKIIAYSASGEKEFDMLFSPLYVYDLWIDDNSLPVIDKTDKTDTSKSSYSRQRKQSVKSKGSSSSNSGMVWVDGYYRKNGSYVKGHWRRK
jgi:hypothetical protein